MRPSWTRNRSQIQSCLSVTITALPKSSSAGIAFVASRACSAQPRNISFAERLVGLIKPLQKQNPNDDCDFREKVDVSKRQGDEMAIFSFHVQLCNPGKQYSLNGAPPLNIPVGLVSGISGVHKSGSGASSARRRATRGFFLEIADVAREHQTHDQPTESGKLFVGQHVSPSLGVCRPWRRRNESKCHASRCKCQWHTGWLCLCPFLTNSCPQISAEPDFESPRAVSRPRAFCRALSHLQARSTQMAPCLCITCVHSVL